MSSSKLNPISPDRQVAPLHEQRARLQDAVERALARAREAGATGAEAGISLSQGLAVTVRLGEVETIEHTRDKGLGITVYMGQRTGAASTTDLSPAAIDDTVRAACAIARHTAEDTAAGLADPKRLAREFPELDLYHPWHPPVDEVIEMARACEDAARSVDARIVNSEGASVTTHEEFDVYGNSHGFFGAVPATRHSLSVSVIAQDDSGMQRDYWWSTSRLRAEIESGDRIGREAARRTVRRLNARKLSTRRCPVLYDAPLAGSLLSHFISAVRGGALYRHASFLLDHLGKQIFAPGIHIYEQPHLRRGLGSAVFDSEGVATQARDLVRDGVLQGYVLDSYSARKLGMETTGNAGGVHNLTLTPGTQDQAALVKEMGTGLLVTELIGFGINNVTGDYSRGAAGFWVENGEIQYPVEEITVAGNLKDMFRAIAAVGSDVDLRSSTRTGSILIESMTLAGS